MNYKWNFRNKSEGLHMQNNSITTAEKKAQTFSKGLSKNTLYDIITYIHEKRSNTQYNKELKTWPNLIHFIAKLANTRKTQEADKSARLTCQAMKKSTCD